MLPLQGAQVPALVGELRSHKLHGVAKKEKEKKMRLREEKQHMSPHCRPGAHVCRDDAEFIWGRVESQVGKEHPGRCPSWQGFAAVELGEEIQGPSGYSWYLKV